MVLFTIICIINNNSLYSQCKLETKKNDFGEGKSFYTKDITIFAVFPLIGDKKPWNLNMSFDLTDNDLSIIVTHQSQSYSTSLSFINFRFNDGTIINKIPSLTDDYHTGLGYSYTYTEFHITKEELELFSSKNLLKFQAGFNNFPDYPLVENDLKNNTVSRIKKDALCILNQFHSNSSTKKIDNTNIKKDNYEYICGYEIDKIDAFTKKRNVQTKPATIFDIATKTNGRSVLSLIGNNIDGINSLKFWYAFIYFDIAKLPESSVKTYTLYDQVDILLDNDEAICLKSDEISDFLLQSIAAYTSKQFIIEDNSIWQKLKTHRIKTIRLSIKGKELRTNDIDENHSNSIINVINCIDVLGISKSK